MVAKETKGVKNSPCSLSRQQLKRASRRFPEYTEKGGQQPPERGWGGVLCVGVWGGGQVSPVQLAGSQTRRQALYLPPPSTSNPCHTLCIFVSLYCRLHTHTYSTHAGTNLQHTRPGTHCQSANVCLACWAHVLTNSLHTPTHRTHTKAHTLINTHAHLHTPTGICTLVGPQALVRKDGSSDFASSNEGTT